MDHQAIAISDLPQELVDHITGCMSFKGLKQAALVSRAWLDSSRRHLFRSMRIHTYRELDVVRAEGGRDLVAFASMLDQYPHIGPYPKFVKISGLVDFLALLRVLRHLTQLHELLLGGVVIHCSRFKLPLLPRHDGTIRRVVLSSVDLEFDDGDVTDSAPKLSWVSKLYVASMFSAIGELRIAGPCLSQDSKSDPLMTSHLRWNDYIVTNFPPLASIVVAVARLSLDQDVTSSPFVEAILNTLDPDTKTLHIHAWPFLSCLEFEQVADFSHVWRRAQQNSSSSCTTLQLNFNIHKTDLHIWGHACVALATCCLSSLRKVVLRFARGWSGAMGARAWNRMAAALCCIEGVEEIVLDLADYHFGSWIKHAASEMWDEVKRHGKQCSVTCIRAEQRIRDM